MGEAWQGNDALLSTMIDTSAGVTSRLFRRLGLIERAMGSG